MRCRKRPPKRSIERCMRGTSAISMPVPTIIFHSFEGAPSLVRPPFGRTQPALSEAEGAGILMCFAMSDAERYGIDPLQQPVAAINHFALHHASLRSQAMRFYRACAVNMQHLMTVRHQPVGNQHAMAAKVYALSAHIRGARTLGQRYQFRHRTLKFPGQHVVSVVAEAVIAQSNVRRVLTNFLAIAAKRRHPDIPNSGLRQTLLQRLAVKLR